MKKNYILLIILNVLLMNISFAQNVLTDSDYYNAYSDLPIIDYAKKAWDLDYKLCDFLSSNESFDKKMAVVDAFNIESENEGGDLYKLFLLNKYNVTKIEELTNTEDRLILSYLYFTNDINKSIEILENTSKIDQNRQSMMILSFLIHSQSVYEKKCEIWQRFQKIDNKIFDVLDFRTEALDLLAQGINKFKSECSSEVLVITQTKREYDTKQISNVKRFKLNYHGGVYTINAKINGVVNLDFVLDSGASIVLIPEDVFRVLTRAGTIDESDFIGMQTFSIADGSTMTKPVFNLKSLTIGDIELTNIKASMGELDSDLLLGQSFQRKFKLLKIDNVNQELIVEQ